ncbi:terminase small subunit (plasmid) [Apilactobacillus apisilvae]|uniref:Terminase small subunit n=1 Tax=Apilactobacillus apisilvae TaxID=2923364 RepID=A0ABY4PKD7_9LACO|nr:terminase small subunit [Apilactobacillus apisilvae]UQS85854.1 terminase small subunit [Apilactobacillus apisilvae]
MIVSKATQFKYEKFVDAYIKMRNGTKAAIAAGYSPKTARTQASQLLQRKDIQASMQKHIEAMENADIASEKEVMQYYSRVMRNQEYDEVSTVDGTYITIPSIKDRNKAAEMLGRFRGSFTDNHEINANISDKIEIIDDVPLIGDDNDAESS